MNRFDSLFFSQYIGSDETLVEVFHRHLFVIIEDVFLWIFFGVVIPGFLYYFDVFGIHAGVTNVQFGIYITLIYAIVMYKVFDWYADVWVATESTLVDVKWRWFTSNLLYIPYDKIEGIEVRTRSWLTAMVGMSDVIIKLAGQESFALESAKNPSEIVEFVQEKTKGKKHGLHDEDKEPFDVLVEALTGVVKGHLTTHGKQYITRDYVEKLDGTLTSGKPIDLRTREEKILIQNWKDRYEKKDNHEGDEEGYEDHDGHHGTH